MKISLHSIYFYLFCIFREFFIFIKLLHFIWGRPHWIVSKGQISCTFIKSCFSKVWKKNSYFWSTMYLQHLVDCLGDNRCSVNGFGMRKQRSGTKWFSLPEIKLTLYTYKVFNIKIQILSFFSRMLSWISDWIFLFFFSVSSNLWEFLHFLIF